MDVREVTLCSLLGCNGLNKTGTVESMRKKVNLASLDSLEPSNPFATMQAHYGAMYINSHTSLKG